MVQNKDLVDNQHRKKEIEQERILLAELKKYGIDPRLKRKERRDVLKLYYDILYAIQEEASSGEPRPTRVQFLSNTSYDKLMRYLKDLGKKNMINEKPLSLTLKGRQFLGDYKKIIEYI